VLRQPVADPAKPLRQLRHPGLPRAMPRGVEFAVTRTAFAVHQLSAYRRNIPRVAAVCAVMILHCARDVSGLDIDTRMPIDCVNVRNTIGARG
jgi:hypothetical protein